MGARSIEPSISTRGKKIKESRNQPRDQRRGGDRTNEKEDKADETWRVRDTAWQRIANQKWKLANGGNRSRLEGDGGPRLFMNNRGAYQDPGAYRARE